MAADSASFNEGLVIANYATANQTRIGMLLQATDRICGDDPPTGVIGSFVGDWFSGGLSFITGEYKAINIA